MIFENTDSTIEKDPAIDTVACSLCTEKVTKGTSLGLRVMGKEEYFCLKCMGWLTLHMVQEVPQLQQIVCTALIDQLQELRGEKSSILVGV
jgi:hypothetical protein